jgi:hypothetical protein
MWEPESLTQGAGFWQAQGAGGAVLDVTRTLLTEYSHRPIGHSAPGTKPPGFANALAPSMAGGNAMMLNHAARQLMAEAEAGVSPIGQGCWAHQVTSGCAARCTV